MARDSKKTALESYRKKCTYNTENHSKTVSAYNKYTHDEKMYKKYSNVATRLENLRIRFELKFSILLK